MGWRWGFGWRWGLFSPWPGRGPFSYLPPWLRPGWIYGPGACWWLFGYNLPWRYPWHYYGYRFGYYPYWNIFPPYY